VLRGSLSRRIEELQARNERKAEMVAMSRDELIAILTDIIKATRRRLSEARIADGLKAAEMLSKLCGWNEPEKVNVRSVEVKVDAALIEQLRAGYAELGIRQQQQVAASVAASSEEKGQPPPLPASPRSTRSVIYAKPAHPTHPVFSERTNG
jgi:hypothetical protein